MLACPGSHQQGITYALHHVDIVGGVLSVQLFVSAGAGSINGFQLVYEGGLGTNYCTSNVNSTGSAAGIMAEGSDSVAAADLTLKSQPVPNQPGIFFYAPSQTSVPFGHGILCVTGGIARLPVTVASGNVATFVVDFSSLPAVGQINPGDTWNFQHWYRDPAAGGAAFNTSDGVSIVFTP